MTITALEDWDSTLDVLLAGCVVLLNSLTPGSDLRPPSWSHNWHRKWAQSDGALDGEAHAQRLCPLHRWGELPLWFICRLQLSNTQHLPKGRNESWCRDSATDQELFRYRPDQWEHSVVDSLQEASAELCSSPSVSTGASCRWRRRPCCSQSSSRATSYKNWSRSTNVRFWCVCVFDLVLSDYAVVCCFFHARVFTDGCTPDEGTRSFGIWKRDAGSFSNPESKWRAVQTLQHILTQHSALTTFPVSFRR